LIAALSLFAIAINIFVLVSSLIVMVFKGQNKQILTKQLAQTCFAIVIPILVIPILLAIEIAYGYVALRIMETRLLQQVQQSPNQLFKYGRFDFRQFPGSSRWVIYDESDQVLLPPQQRSKEWWVTTKEDQEADVACLGEAQLIYSHFFIRFDNCS
jgi:hypothetical protein